MQPDLLEQAIELVEKANANLEPELLRAAEARKVLALYSRLEKLGAFGRVALARKIEDPVEIARMAGTSIGRAKETVSTARVLGRATELNEALKQGEISFDQAAEIAKAEESAPGVSRKLLDTARKESFRVLKDEARKAKLEAEQHRDLAVRQHHARFARTHADELGMVHIHLSLEPHIGSPIVARAEAEASRLLRAAKAGGGNRRRRAAEGDAVEPFDRYLADAYAALLSGRGKSRSTRPELVVLVSHEVAKRGWTHVHKGEVCKIPGVGPVPPDIARRIGQDAFSAVSSSTARICGTSSAGRAASLPKCASPSSSATHLASTESPASIVETVSAASSIMSSHGPLEVRRRSRTSSLAVGAVTKRRRSAIARAESSDRPTADAGGG